uniref:PEX5-related protein n=1 Tax=Sphaeramia orbicularis TaxID=375764 RepID=A0A673BXJ7_9TELE
ADEHKPHSSNSGSSAVFLIFTHFYSFIFMLNIFLRTRSLLARNESLEDEFVRAKAAVESDTEFWDKMQAEWEELARRNWLEESETQRPIPPTVSPVEKGYYFNTTNPYRDWPNAFAEGQDKAREGDLNSAVLLLEAAILQDPQDSEAWQVLGMTQAENENEQAAIVSLQRCLELRPNNLPALMALAVSFTNSGMQREACDALQRWISHNPRYKHLISNQRSNTTPEHHVCPCVSSCRLQDILLLFQDAALLNLDCVDPDLQTGLGVLFNLSCDFNKAVEAFTAALSIRPQDYLLWNRLGATLANGNRSEEAVEAYSRALELQPGFIRSRYNLGISCINLGAHREAVSNFLMALNQQRRSQRCSQQQMSANIWTALRIAISMMDRPELFQAASVGDLDLLMRAFDVGDV